MGKTALKICALILVFGLAHGLFAVFFLMDSKNPRVVLVYTQKESIPDIAFKISSVPLALASYLKNRANVFAALHANDKNIQFALASAEFVVIGTHGWDGRILSDDGNWIGPNQTTNQKMRSVYFGSCYFGAKRKAWEAMFPKAIVTGYESETYPFKGWLYLVFESWVDLSKVKFAE